MLPSNMKRIHSVWVVALLFIIANPVHAQDMMHHGTMGAMPMTGENHDAHEEMMQSEHVKKSVQHYHVPAITLLNQNGEKVDIEAYLDTSKPVVMDFIFSTCSTICPVLSATFSNFQKRMGDKHSDIQLVSISIDPDNDTPEVLNEYLSRYDAMDSWDIFTGKRTDVTEVLKAFKAYVPNKMDHFPLTIMRAPGSDTWVRMEGLMSATDLQKEYEQMMAHQAH